MKFLLEVKAWVIFIIVVLPALLTVPAPIQGMLNVISISGLLLWLFSIGYYGNKKLNEIGLLHEKNMSLFTICILVFLGLAVFNFLFWKNAGDGNVVEIIFGLIALITFFYPIALVSKIIVKLEKGREVEFSEYIVTLVSIIIFPIGIWFVQPRVNKIFASSQEKA